MQLDLIIFVTYKIKVIYVLRNPKDTLVSIFNFAKSFNHNEEFIGHLEEMADLFLESKYWYGSWWAHVDEFVNLPKIHIVHYENLLKNPHKEIKRIAEYLDVDLSDNQLNELVDYTNVF